MSKKLFGLLLFFGFMLNIIPAEAAYTQAVAQKLSRGFGNILYSPMEIPLHVSTEMNGDDYVYALPKGGFLGLIYGVGRLSAGAYEASTFFIPQDPIIPNFNK